MNLGEIVQPDGSIDFDKSREVGTFGPFAEVTVRQWEARVRQHVVVYQGAMRLDDISALARDRSVLGSD